MPNHFIQTNKAIYIMEPWEKHTALAAALLKQRESDAVTVSGDVVTLRCANGSASYRMQSARG
jgi:hypothetical protein